MALLKNSLLTADTTMRLCIHTIEMLAIMLSKLCKSCRKSYCINLSRWFTLWDKWFFILRLIVLPEVADSDYLSFSVDIGSPGRVCTRPLKINSFWNKLQLMSALNPIRNICTRNWESCNPLCLFLWWDIWFIWTCAAPVFRKNINKKEMCVQLQAGRCIQFQRKEVHRLYI